MGHAASGAAASLAALVAPASPAAASASSALVAPSPWTPCAFDHIFRQSFCCDPAYAGECPGPLGDGGSCCDGFDAVSAREFQDLQWTTINPAALKEHAEHLKASKGALFDVGNIFQLVRVRGQLALLAAQGLAPDMDYLGGLGAEVAERWSASRFAAGGGLDLPMRVAPGSPEGFRVAMLQPLVDDVGAISTAGDVVVTMELARRGQHAFERFVLWDQWLRAAEPWGPPPAVRLYVDACCTEHDLVAHLLAERAGAREGARAPALAIVGTDGSGVAGYAAARGASVLLASGAGTAVGSDVATVLPAPLDPHAEPQYPRVELVDPAEAVSDASLDVVFLSVTDGFASYFAALSAWTPKLRAGGAMVGFFALTTADAAAAVYIFARQRGLELNLATHRCAFFVKQ